MSTEEQQQGGEQRRRPASGVEEPPGRDPGDLCGERSPHAALSNPVGEPDPTEWPDPYESRPDPRYPEGLDGSGGEQPHTPGGAESTSEPHPDEDFAETRPPQREKMDE